MLTNAMARPEATSASGNLDLVLATMEGLTGSVSLAAMKARGKIIRPFTTLDAMERDFDRSVAPAVSELQANIAAAESELQGLARKANDGEEILLKEEILRNSKITEGKISRAREELARNPAYEKGNDGRPAFAVQNFHPVCRAGACPLDTGPGHYRPIHPQAAQEKAMGNRQLIRLAIVAFILTGAVVLVGALEDRQEVTLKEGSYLLGGFNPEKVHGIYVQKGGESLTFKRKDERFVIPGNPDTPVSNDRINRIVNGIAQIRCAEKVTTDPRNHEALGVAGGGESLVIRFFTESGKKMTGVIIGSDRQGSAGFYARLEDEKQVYRSIDSYPPVSTNSEDYIRKNPAK